jgi:hypothetical protein
VADEHDAVYFVEAVTDEISDRRENSRLEILHHPTLGPYLLGFLPSLQTYQIPLFAARPMGRLNARREREMVGWRRARLGIARGV